MREFHLIGAHGDDGSSEINFARETFYAGCKQHRQLNFCHFRPEVLLRHVRTKDSMLIGLGTNSINFTHSRPTFDVSHSLELALKHQSSLTMCSGIVTNSIDSKHSHLTIDVSHSL